MQKAGNPLAFDTYKQALSDYNAALTYDPDNKMAILKKNQISSIIKEYRNIFYSDGLLYESKQDPVDALIYYRKSASVQEDNLNMTKIRNLSTNSVIKRYIQYREKSIAQAVKTKSYLLAARNQAEVLMLISPDDPEIRDLDNQINDIIRPYPDKFYDTAKKYYDSYMYQECINYLNYALAYDPDMKRAIDLRNQATLDMNIANDLDNAYQQYNSRNYLNALRITDVLSKTKNVSELAVRITNQLKANMKYYEDTGKTYYNNSDYDNAVVMFNSVLAVDPSNSEALDYRNRAQAKINAIQQLNTIGDTNVSVNSGAESSD